MSDKILKLSQAQTLYQDLRGRIDALPTDSDIPEVPVQDVQVNGTSILSNGVANVPVATHSKLGVSKAMTAYGIGLLSTGDLYLFQASNDQVKAGTESYRALTPAKQDQAAFYGLSKVAGIDLANETVTLGTYPDAAKAAIQHMLGTDTNLADYESDTTADQAYAIGELFMLNGKLHQATAVIAIGDTFTVGTNCAVVNAADVFPHDVQVNGTSVVSGGVANVPIAQGTTFGVVRENLSYGIDINNGYLSLLDPIDTITKVGAAIGNVYRPVLTKNQHKSTFYGLAAAAGDTTQSASNNTVGTYTSEAKAAIQSMLGIDLATIATQVEIPLVETVSGTTPTITGQPNTRYICSEVSTLSITPPASGSIDVVFESGSTATVLTVPNTVKWPAWFDATSLEEDTTYEILITDGVYGSVMTWVT